MKHTDRRQNPAAPEKSSRASRHSGPKGGESWLYGIHAVSAAWQNPNRRVNRLIATDGGLESLKDAMAEAKHLGLLRPSPARVERKELDNQFPDAVHQGVAVDVSPLPDVTIEDLCAAPVGPESQLIMVLDQVTDPHNVGAVLRSASAFGACAVVVTERHAPEVTGVLAKTASGALESVPLVRAGNLAHAMEQLKQAGYWCIGLAESGKRVLSDVDMTGRIALIMGAEGPGLRRLTMERCDELVHLPTQGIVGSLNVSNAAAVSLYEVARQRKKA